MQGQEAINQWKLNQAKLDNENAQSEKFRAEAKKASMADDPRMKIFNELAKNSSPKAVAQAINNNYDISMLDSPEKTKLSGKAQELVDSGLAYGTPEFNAKMKEYIQSDITGKAKGSATNVSVNMDKSAGNKVGDILEKGLPGAEQAVGSLQTVNQLRKIVNSKDLIVGPGANIRTNLARISNVYFGGNNPEQLGNTRTAIQGLANLALNARSRLQGSGAISNYEQEVVQRATSAGIEELTVPEMKVLLDIVERDAKQTYSNYERKYKKVKDPDLQEFYAPPPIPQMDSGTTRPAGSPTLRWNPKTKSMEKV
jgi:hypothetical protein